jgi:hypothetical protein
MCPKTREVNMKIKFIFISLILSVFISCGKNELISSPESIEKYWLRYNIGQTWTYREMFINKGLWDLIKIPDTLYNYSVFEVTKDTIFENLKWLIIEGNDYECRKDTINKYNSRYAITFTDTSLKVYQFKDIKDSTIRFSWGLFKADGLNIYDSSSYDLTTFSDLFEPIVFNVDSGYTWFMRREHSSNFDVPTQKVYLGQEEITVPAGKFISQKFRTFYGEPFGVTDIQVYSWYDSIGLVKRWFYEAEKEIGTLGIVPSWSIVEYIGKGKINPDTLTPWGKK